MNQVVSEHAELNVLMRNCLSLQNDKCIYGKMLLYFVSLVSS